MQHCVRVLVIDRRPHHYRQNVRYEDQILLVHLGVVFGRREGLAGDGGHVYHCIRTVPYAFAGDLAVQVPGQGTEGGPENDRGEKDGFRHVSLLGGWLEGGPDDRVDRFVGADPGLVRFVVLDHELHVGRRQVGEVEVRHLQGLDGGITGCEPLVADRDVEGRCTVSYTH